MRAPITAKQRCRSSGNWATWTPAAMRFTRVALVIYSSRYFSPRMSSGLLSSPTDWDLERVLSAIRASVSEASANPGMGTRMYDSAHVWEGTPRLPLSPFDALLNAQQLCMAHSTPPVHQPHRPYPSRPHQWTIRAPDDRRTHPPMLSTSYIVSLSPALPSGSQALELPSLIVSTQPLSPIQRRFSRSTFSEPPRIPLWRPQAIIRLRNGPNTRKIRTLRTTSWSRLRHPLHPAHIHRRVLVHAPHRAITILRPKPSPRAGHVPFLRSSDSPAIASSTPLLLTHHPRTSPRLLSGDSMPILCLRNVFAYCRHSAQSLLSLCFRRARRQPPGIPRHDQQGGESYYQPSMSHPPSISLI
ncbi:hypothetical protein DFH08DRAFT_898731 [Mycena albidolilacea]|uniref:Uncharacterized protein n=1 Tax=Mycena albidolilacea TaxID=1033008 RepID=A0AAD6Z728_9AGAR|nr:hypothetical protein DFH08DRAFT_898731 [Mycena albidolilacea]